MGVGPGPLEQIVREEASDVSGSAPIGGSRVFTRHGCGPCILRERDDPNSVEQDGRSQKYVCDGPYSIPPKLPDTTGFNLVLEHSSTRTRSRILVLGAVLVQTPRLFNTR